MTATAPEAPIPPRAGAAVALMLGCCALMSVVSLIAKTLGSDLAGPPLHPIQITAARYGFACIVFAVAFAILRPGWKGTPFAAHAFRSSVGMLGFVCLFAAVAQMPLTEANAIAMLSPFVTLILAIPVLGERPGPWRWAAAAASFIGALLIIRPGSDAFQPAAVIALGAALFTGFEATLVKRLSRGEPVIRILLMNNGFAAAISVTTAALLFWTDPTPTQWAMMAGLGVCMATAASLFTVAFKLADASALMPITYAMLVFTLAYDILLFDLVPPALTLIGALVIGAATALLGWREHRARRKLIAAQLGA